MAKRTYHAALKKAIDRASADQFAGRTPDELRTLIDDCTTMLKAPLYDGERINLAAKREAARKALAAQQAAP